MSADYAKKERAFLDTLQVDTGHPLETWLEMIDAELLEERNDIIDWLRQHGFTFSRASWIERIHHNGGQPIYADADRASGPRSVTDEPPTRLERPVKAAPHQKKVDRARAQPAENTKGGSNAARDQTKTELRVVASNSAPRTATPHLSQDASAIEQTLTRAKGLRPLAQHIVAEIKTVVPNVKISAIKSALVFANGSTPFGLLGLSAKDLRLGLALTPGGVQPPFAAAQFTASYARISENITHMLVVDDVRQITPAVLSGVQKPQQGPNAPFNRVHTTDLPNCAVFVQVPQRKATMTTRPIILSLRTTTACALTGLCLLASSFNSPTVAQTVHRDSISDLLSRVGVSPANAAQVTPEDSQAAKAGAQDPRAGDPAYEQARRLMSAVDAILKDTASERSQARKLPGNDDFILTPLWTETREDREEKIRNLLDSALGIVTDVPVVEVQNKIEGLRKTIRETEDNIVSLKEKQITAPRDAMLPGVLTDTVNSLQQDIETSEKRIAESKAEIVAAKIEIHDALQKSGIALEKDQVDLLLDSVLSGDLVRLVATFNAAKLIDGQLGKMMSAAGENINASRKYFAMHAALFAMLVHAQNSTIEKIDTHYLPRLDAILKDIRKAKGRTQRACCVPTTGLIKSAHFRPIAPARSWLNKRHKVTNAICANNVSKSLVRGGARRTISTLPTIHLKPLKRAFNCASSCAIAQHHLKLSKSSKHQPSIRFLRTKNCAESSKA